MPTIVSAEIILNTPQQDGRLSVIEQFTDENGNVYQRSYLAAADADVNANLAADALSMTAQLQAQATNTEIAANVAAVIAQGSTAMPTFNFSTEVQNAQALLEAYNTASGITLINIGDYLNAQTDAFLAAGSGMTSAQIDGFRTVWAANAQTAAAVRAATIA